MVINKMWEELNGTKILNNNEKWYLLGEEFEVDYKIPKIDWLAYAISDNHKK